MVLTDELCELLSQEAREESKRIGVDISFTVVDEKGLLLLYKRFGDAVLISIGISQNKAYTSAMLRTPTQDLAVAAFEGGPLFGINTADPKVVFIAGGFPLLHNGRVVGAIGVGGGSQEQDIQIGQHVVKMFEEMVNKY